jgi:hypothetical protein
MAAQYGTAHEFPLSDARLQGGDPDDWLTATFVLQAVAVPFKEQNSQ